MTTLLQDLRHAMRSLARSPGFTAAILLTLGLGIGADVAIFSVAHGVLLKPLPFPEGDRLVRIGHVRPDSETVGASFSPQDFEDLERAKPDLRSVAAWSYSPNLTGKNLTGAGEPERIETAAVSGSFFPTLGMGAHLGRAIAPEDDRPGQNHVAVVSAAFWKRRLGGDRNAVGQTVKLDGEAFTIIGVMPPVFQMPDAAVDAWIPLSTVGEDSTPHRRGVRWLDVVGRLERGSTMPSARAGLDALFSGLAARFPDSNTGFERSLVVSLRTALTGDVRSAILVLLGAVSLVLLIACANVAHLLLARASARSREAAIRTALGASRARLVRQRLTESLGLALVGGAIGLLLARWGIDALTLRLDGALPRAAEISLDPPVVGFALVLSLLTGLASGLLPALQESRADLRQAMEAGGRSGTPAHTGRRLRRALVLCEISVAVALLFGAGLLIRSFWRLTHVDSGMRADAVLATSITISGPRYEDVGREAAYRDAVLSRLRALPGVVAVGGSKTWPLQGGGEPYAFTAEGGKDPKPIVPEMGAIIVTPGYFGALGIPVLRGRDFTQADLTSAARVLLVNRTLAARLWPGEDPVGKGLVFGGKIRLEVIGVAGDVRAEGLTVAPGGAIYVPESLFPRGSLKIFVRTAGRPAGLATAIRDSIRRLDPDQPVSRVVPFRELVSETVTRPRLLTGLVGVFGGAALLLAALGIYGVISYGVSRRTREIGIRMALGADGQAVRRLIVREGMTLAAAGVAMGALAGLALGRSLRSVLFEVPAGDAATLVGVAVLLSAVAWLATWIPARRATRIDPIAALRAE